MRVLRQAARLAAVITVVIAVAGCRDDSIAAPVTPPIEPPALTAAEAREVVEALATVSSINLAAILGDGPLSEKTVPAAAWTVGDRVTWLAATAFRDRATPLNADFFTDTVPCPAAGSLIVRGRLVIDSVGLARFDYRDDYRGCATSSGGKAWTFDAELPMHTCMEIVHQSAPDAPWIEGFIVGAVRFTRGDFVGRCTVAVELSSEGAEVGFGGSVCGHSIAALRLSGAAQPSSVNRSASQ